MTKPNPSTDSPLSAEEEAQLASMLRERVGESRGVHLWGDHALRVAATLDAARAAHPESRPDPGEGSVEVWRLGEHAPDDQGSFEAPCLVCGERWPCEPYRFLMDLAAEGQAARRGASPVPTDRPEPIDEERLARALLLAVPGYQRWLQWPVLTANEAHAREDALDAEVYSHARAIAAAYRTEPGETL